MKKAVLLVLPAIILVFGMIVVGCKTAGKTSNNIEAEISRFYKIDTASRLRLSLLNSSGSTYIANTSGDQIPFHSSFIQDFKVYIDGTAVTLNGINILMGIELYLPYSFTVGNKYEIKVIYTANPNRVFMDYNGNSLKSFTSEKTLEYYGS